MKKVIICLLVVSFALGLSACGNLNMGLGNYTYEHAHICVGAEQSFCCNITSWHDNSSGVELHTSDYGNLFCAEGTYILFDNAESCPYCGGVE